jgi:hypothetical protein
MRESKNFQTRIEKTEPRRSSWSFISFDDCKKGETSAKTGCTPASGEGGKKEGKGGKKEGAKIKRANDFKTGQPITFPFIKNMEKAPKAKNDDSFAQKIEPAGNYISAQEWEGEPAPGWKTGEVTFENPLVMEWGTSGYGGWKSVLSDKFGGKKGKALSKAIAKSGYDGIVTKGKSRGEDYISEIVDLTFLHERKT